MLIKEAKKRILNHTDSLDEEVRDRGISYNLYEIILKMENKNISGNGWTLELKDGYSVTKNESTGNYKLTKK